MREKLLLEREVALQAEKKLHQVDLGGGFKDCLFSSPKLGEMIQFWRAYFSKGLVQPPTSDPKWGAYRCPFGRVCDRIKGDENQYRIK